LLPYGKNTPLLFSNHFAQITALKSFGIPKYQKIAGHVQIICQHQGTKNLQSFCGYVYIIPNPKNNITNQLPADVGKSLIPGSH
jgi:hypothetical protein